MASPQPVAFSSNLTGNETMRAFGIAGNSQPSGEDFYVNVQQISAYAHAPVSVGASATATIGNSNKVHLLSAASGSVLTLPAATGSGAWFRICVSTTVTSNSHKILAASTSDNLQGHVHTEDSGTVTGWYAALSSTFCSLQLNGSTTGGFQGDWFDIVDIATNVWEVRGLTKSTGTAATPFSTADS